MRWVKGKVQGWVFVVIIISTRKLGCEDGGGLGAP